MKKIIVLITAITLLLAMSICVFGAEPGYKPCEVNITVNGTAYTLLGYEVPGGQDGVKLRDIAYILNGTSKQFGVAFESGTVSITTGKPYTPMGTELAQYTGTEPSGFYSRHMFLLNGEYCAIEATLASDYNYVPLATFLYNSCGIIAIYNEDGSITIDTEIQLELDEH